MGTARRVEEEPLLIESSVYFLQKASSELHIPAWVSVWLVTLCQMPNSWIKHTRNLTIVLVLTSQEMSKVCILEVSGETSLARLEDGLRLGEEPVIRVPFGLSIERRTSWFTPDILYVPWDSNSRWIALFTSAIRAYLLFSSMLIVRHICPA